MFLLKIVCLSMAINLLGLSVVKSDTAVPESGSFEESRTVSRVRNWVPIPIEAETKKLYHFNITNLDNYLDNKDEKIEVEELEPIVVQATSSSIPRILEFSANENIVTFQLNHSYIIDAKSVDKFHRNGTIFKVNDDSVAYLESSQNFKDLLKNPLDHTSKQRAVTLFRRLRMIGPKNFKPHHRVSVYNVYTGKDYQSLEGKLENKAGHDESICFSSNSPCSRSHKGSSDVRLQFMKKQEAFPDNEFELRVLFFNRPMTFIRNNTYQFEGINLTRFLLDDSEMSMQSEDNKCLCEDRSKTIDGVSLCDMTGILDAKRCKLEATIYSNPHFLNASPVLRDNIKGLKPDVSRHKSYVDVDPITGNILNYRLSIQLNRFVRMSNLGYKSNIVLPHLRIEYVNDFSCPKYKINNCFPYLTVFGTVKFFHGTL